MLEPGGVFAVPAPQAQIAHDLNPPFTLSVQLMRLRVLALAAFIAALSVSVPVTSGSLTAFEWTRAVPRTDVVLRMLLSGGINCAGL